MSLSDVQEFGIAEAEGGKFLKLDPSTYPELSSYFEHGQYAVATYETNNGLSISGQRSTSFDELITSNKTLILNLKPTWGISSLRDTLTSTGSGTSITNGGEISLSTGLSSNGAVKLQTNQRGQYQAGATGECGVGIRIPNNPVGNQYAEWGYFDDENGLGYGVDSTGVYSFVLDDSVKEKIYQNVWDVDKLDGEGPSGRTLELSSGNIFEISFVWYGYGEIDYSLNIDEPTLPQKRVKVHREARRGGVSIQDPNQPITVKVDNAGEESDFRVYVGGRQFSIITGQTIPQRRSTSVELYNQSVTNSTFQPFLSIRKKDLFNGRKNSIKTSFKSIDIAATTKIYWYVSIGDVTNTTYGSINNVLSSETALERGTPSSVIDQSNKRALLKGFVIAGNRLGPATLSKTDEITIGDDQEIVLWIRRTSNNSTVDVVMNFEEEW